MKIWVTRGSAFSIQCGGLDRLQVWFRKPTYMFELLRNIDRDSPFGDLHQTEYGCFKRVGWQVVGSNVSGVDNPTSFGKLFGYHGGENHTLSEFVWGELIKHFESAPIENWNKIDVKIEDFLLEIDLKISM